MIANYPSETASRDDVLEYAARLAEEKSFGDLRGIAARRKRDREDAELRLRVIEETRREIAAHIRAAVGRKDLHPISILGRLAAIPADAERAAMMYVQEAWPLAWMGLVRIDCIIRCNSNVIPPETDYRIALTERGRKALETGSIEP